MDSPSKSTNLHDLRAEYRKGALDAATVAADPISQFSQWFDDAVGAKLPEPNAMVFATADASGVPSARVLLLKGFDERGFVFFTNYASRKGRDLAANPRAAMVFFWQALERQVRVEGSVEKVSRAESDLYFHSRPRESQIGAWVSQQSRVIGSRAELEAREAEYISKFAGGAVPLPDFWGGYRLLPESVEFWQGRPSRLHDRVVYIRQADGAWKIDRLEP
jgi:pyridoxamine 5'-phosphate oxidase